MRQRTPGRAACRPSCHSATLRRAVARSTLLAVTYLRADAAKTPDLHPAAATWFAVRCKVDSIHRRAPGRKVQQQQLRVGGRRAELTVVRFLKGVRTRGRHSA